ncbi:MAG: type II secretion system protein [Lachnospiraceae bacterium]|nr:type II secretion system protein [Lachnospiraceae bacterium]
MKNIKNNKGFTLVELIVVIVILAILAAILVPALLGYIDKAKNQQDILQAKNYQTAMQSVLSEMYAKDEEPNYEHRGLQENNENSTSYTWWNSKYGKKVLALADETSTPYILMFQVGRYPKYKDSNTHYAYTVYGVFYQKSADSELVIIQNGATYTADDYNGIRDYVMVNGEKIWTVVYSMSCGSYSTPAVALQSIEKHQHKK